MIWVVTSPERVHEEAVYLNELAAAGADVILLRKPGWALPEYTALLDKMQHPARVMIAGHPSLLEQYPVMGLHVNEAGRADFTPPAIRSTILSTSVHTQQSPGSQWHYLLMGPVFDSISKTGYSGRGHLFTAIPRNSIAIGGVQAANIRQVKNKGFYGAALLGTLWSNPATALKNFQTIQQLWEHS